MNSENSAVLEPDQVKYDPALDLMKGLGFMACLQGVSWINDD